MMQAFLSISITKTTFGEVRWCAISPYGACCSSEDSSQWSFTDPHSSVKSSAVLSQIAALSCNTKIQRTYTTNSLSPANDNSNTHKYIYTSTHMTQSWKTFMLKQHDR